MSTFHVIGDVKEKTIGSTLNKSSVLHQIEKKHITVKDSNGVPISSTATSSTKKLSITSTAEGKSVVSSLSMLLERKDSIQYIPRKIAPCIIPAGQSTVIHLDNYSHFMAQRVTTKTAIKRAEIISEDHDPIIVPSPTTARKSSSGIGFVDVDLKVILGGVNSSKNKTLDMNKQKMLDIKSSTAPFKLRGRKNSLALDYNKAKEVTKMVVLKTDKPNIPPALKPILRKSKTNQRKKVIKPRQARKSRIKSKTVAEQPIVRGETSAIALDRIQLPHNTQPTSKSKILLPCAHILQSRKCLSEMTCPYLHSDFPCKYYYLNLLCPQGFKCQFMHNGPLEPKLLEALRKHILDLLSTNPSAAESHFVQQMYNIEDLSQRLQSFHNNQGRNYEVVEVIDDTEEDQVLVIDESSNDMDRNNFADTTTINSLSNTLDEVDENHALQPLTNKLDELYENLKETNFIIDEIGKKLKNLKTTSNMSSKDKIRELQNIYDILKEQEKRLPTYDNINIVTTTAQVPTTYTNDCENAFISLPSPNLRNEQSHIDLVSPDIAKEIQTSRPQEDLSTINGDENTMTLGERGCSQATNSKVTQVVNSEFPINDGIEFITAIELQQLDSSGNNETARLPKDSEIHDNMDYEENSATNMDIDLNHVENTEKNTEQIIRNNNNTFEKLPFQRQQFEYTSSQITDESLGQTNCVAIDKTEEKDDNIELNNTLTLHNETIELDIANDEKINIESNIKDIVNKEVKEQPPFFEDNTKVKPEKINRIRLRSHTLHDNEETKNNINSKPLTVTCEPTKPIRTRRLRLPKPSQKNGEKSPNDECQINADVIDKLIKHTEKCKNLESNKETTYLQDVEVPLKQNIILTKRFLKRAKAKFTQQSLLQETVGTNCNNETVQHKADAKNLNGTVVSLHPQTSDDSNSAQYPLTGESDCYNVDNINNHIPTSSENVDHIKSHNKDNQLPVNIEKGENFENPISSSITLKEQFNLGNPHVVLTKLKNSFLVSPTQKDVQADSTTSYFIPIVTSSNLLVDDKSSQKRHSCSSEYDLDSYLKENKCLKIDNSSSIRKLKIDKRVQTYAEQSSDSKDDSDTDLSDEMLTEGNTLKLSPTTSNESQEVFEPSTHVATHPQHTEQQENESDLGQQFEHLSNKTDLQLQTQQQKARTQQQEVIEGISITAATSFITKNINTSPYKQHQQQEKMLVVGQEYETELEHKKQYEEIKNGKEKIANTSDSFDNTEKDEDERTQSLASKSIYEPEKLTSILRNKYSNATTLTETDLNIEYSTYSPMKRQINFSNSCVNITPISSPNYGDNTIASPSPIRKSIDFRMGAEIDGRLTYPPIPYILYAIDLGKTDINKPLCVDKLKKTVQLDPRIFRTHVKKQLTTVCKPVEITSNALVPISTSNNLKLSHASSSFVQPAASMISSSDPRNRTPAIMADMTTLSVPSQTALTPYNSLQTAVTPSSSSFAHTGVPIALQYHSTSQPVIHQQQTPNMFLYGCLQRSPWYQSLMSTMKIQINQSISQLVRALNNFHRERLLNPEIVFDVFKIDCAGELLEIMHSLGIFVDANGIINEQRHVPSFGGRSCCNATPVNATYSFIQQFLTPNSHSTSLSTASSTINAADGTPVGHVNINEPFVSCYVKTSEPVHKHKHSEDSAATNNSQYDANNNNGNYNKNYNDNNNNYNNQNNNRRYGCQTKKPYDNNSGNNNYQQRSSQRYNNYNNNPRFMKPGSSSPNKSNSSPPNSPRNGFEGGNGGYGGGGGRGRGGRYNNNRRFNNNNNNDGKKSFSWTSSSDSNENRYNNKYINNNSPPRNSSPNSSYQSGSPRAAEPKTTSPPPQNNCGKSSTNDSSNEECWDSDN